MKKKVLLLTGRPSVGKTSILLKIVESLRAKGFSAGGMLSREVRVEGTRMGFEILDLSTGRTGWLARISQEWGPRVGKYNVNLKDVESIGVKAIADAIRHSDAIVIDEIGPMELHSQAFKQAVREAVQSAKLVLGVIHWRATDSLVTEIRGREDADSYLVTSESRESVRSLVVEKALDFLSGITRQQAL